ncbi:MAG: HPP family protein, partial [Bacteroidia bacterium]|nr:HPP family protein [Bacteroidia bacterium]
MLKEKIKNTFHRSKKVIARQTDFNFGNHIWTFIGAFLGIGIIGFTQGTVLGEQERVFLIGSFGASAVLVFGAPSSNFAQPRNLLGGHFFSALIGVSVHLLIPGNFWLATSLAVSLSIVIMQLTKTMHPPGGATALIANIGTEKIKNLGYGFVISPVLSGALILLVVALVVNNIPKG